MLRLKIKLLYTLCGGGIFIIAALVVFYSRFYSSETGHLTRNILPLAYRDELFTKPSPKVLPPHPRDGFLVNNQGCRIVDMTPDDASVMQAIKHEPPSAANYTARYTLTYISSDSHLHINKTQLFHFAARAQIDPLKIKCCYRPIFRGLGKNSDMYVRYDKHCFEFEKGVKVKSETFQAECYVQQRRVYKHAHATIQVKSKVEKRCQKVDHKFPVHDRHLSVLIVGIDGTSRQNFHRFMKNSRNLLAEHSAIEIFGFTSVGENTLPNIVPLLTGLSIREFSRQPCYTNRSFSLDSCKYLWNSFASNGFRTAYIEDEPRFNLFASHGGFVRSPTDYYFRNVFLANSNSTSKLLETQETLSLTSQFVEKFHDRRFFALTWLNALTHGNMLGASVLDKVLHEFLTKLVEGNVLKNTLLVLMSDHGPRYGPFRQTVHGWSEAKRPLLYLLFPDWFLERYPDFRTNVYQSSTSIVTTYDLHEMLKNILFHEFYRQHPGRFIDEYDDLVMTQKSPPYHKLYKETKIKGISLFRKFPKARTCAQASVPLTYCPCYAVHQVAHHSEFVSAAIDAIIGRVNSVTKSVRRLCINLTLKALIDVRVMVPNDSSDQYNVMLARKQKLSEVRYMVLLSTSPGGAVFEAIFELDAVTKKQKNLDVLRVSKLNYGHASCVKKSRLKLFCYCRKPKVKSHS